jgi:hypothetical protein
VHSKPEEPPKSEEGVIGTVKKTVGNLFKWRNGKLSLIIRILWLINKVIKPMIGITVHMPESQ